MGEYAFYLCEKLAKVTIGNGLSSIPDAAFQGCGSLTDVTIGSNVTNIVGFTFTGCSSLASLKIPDSVIRVGDWSFAACGSLGAVTVGKGITDLSLCAFAYCGRLTNLYFEGNAPNSTLGDWCALAGDTNTTVYYLPNTKGWSTTFDGRPTALWNPQVQPDSVGIQSNQPGFTIHWASGMSVAVEACTNLANPVWSPVQTITLTGEAFYFSDPQWANYPRRFYRLRWP
jgi:hypothetical protein